ncbi:aminodeoxychorismate lyase [Candidatus Pelagadaptatus aseana]|uniref:aminodeoxychorismate lyase n=1 Tax=Candidatus Pelagadaptatus aseana TaxID=3120508 RepID=UPI003C6FD03E
MKPFLLVNGIPTDTIAVDDRGLAFGDGVFETIRVQAGIMPLWQFHKDRLQHGLNRLGIDVPRDCLSDSLNQLQHYLTHSEPEARHGVTKLMVTRGSSTSGYQYSADIKANVVVRFTPGRVHPPGSEHLIRCETPMYENPRLGGIKHLNRLENVLARQEAKAAGYRDGLLCDSNGHVIETTNSNLFFIDQHQRLVTPELSDCGVAGVLRRLIIEELAPALQLKVTVQTVAATDLAEFKAAFKCNALTGVVEIASIAAQGFVSGNPLIKTIKQAVDDYLVQAIGHPKEHFEF